MAKKMAPKVLPVPNEHASPKAKAAVAAARTAQAARKAPAFGGSKSFPSPTVRKRS